MADRLISADAAIDELLKAFAFHGYAGGMAANVIRQMPTIEAEPVRHGRWVKKQEKDTFAGYLYSYECSECGRVELRKEPYCNCGAKMESEGE